MQPAINQPIENMKRKVYATETIQGRQVNNRPLVFGFHCGRNWKIFRRILIVTIAMPTLPATTK